MRSTNSAPLSLWNSYFTGSPPVGTSMMTLRLSGGLSPTGMYSIRMDARFRKVERHPSRVFARPLGHARGDGERRIAGSPELGHRKRHEAARAPAGRRTPREKERKDARRPGHRVRPS